jgi:hypothetical protein
VSDDISYSFLKGKERIGECNVEVGISGFVREESLGDGAQGEGEGRERAERTLASDSRPW